MITMKNATVHMKHSITVLLLVTIVVTAAYQRKMENLLFSTLEIKEQMRESCSAKVIYALLQEMTCFPVKEQHASAFEDGYGDGRTYGGNRTHEGIDVMSLSGKRGELTVCSVSQGVVEKIGWLPLGGYRVGIRSPQGYYFYYAHLAEYAPGLKTGDRVRAGDALGTMGDTGYGKEGTCGKFPVHLHFGVYRKQGNSEKSLNPYYLLVYLQKKAERE